ncbi:pRL2-8 [Streptomyces sp. NPDC060027]|uniref:pRL2-8 n=1 Tax=Streptomyces sp. NPDC060027 TaxID=3347040 RepID=UPI0036C5008E
MSKDRCPQCEEHAYNPRIHRALGPKEPCGPCEDHANNGCPDRRKTKSGWW